MPPMFDFECIAGHRFEKVVPLAERHDVIACAVVDDSGQPCALDARRIEICHARPSTMLDHGLGANRDAAREGRYDPNRPSTRGVRKFQV
jgi:hypothetical protein